MRERERVNTDVFFPLPNFQIRKKQTKNKKQKKTPPLPLKATFDNMTPPRGHPKRPRGRNQKKWINASTPRGRNRKKWIHASTHPYICYVCMYVRMYVCMYVRMYVRMCACTSFFCHQWCVKLTCYFLNVNGDLENCNKLYFKEVKTEKKKRNKNKNKTKNLVFCFFSSFFSFSLFLPKKKSFLFSFHIINVKASWSVELLSCALHCSA